MTHVVKNFFKLSKQFLTLVYYFICFESLCTCVYVIISNSTKYSLMLSLIENILSVLSALLCSIYMFNIKYILLH